jgi:NAD-dependent deacetylase
VTASDGIAASLIAALRAARHTVVLTGAGVSAESGVATFRDPAGLWSRFRPEDLATPEAFERDPVLVWQWYQWRREQIAQARPNAAHLALAALERLSPRFTLITQNVDGLHQAAGSRQVVEFHGNIQRNRCSRDGEVVTLDVAGSDKPPRCPRCHARVRPDVVWFGEAIPASALSQAGAAAAECDVFLAIGTSAVVQPAAGLALRAKHAGAFVAEINPQQTALSGEVDLCLRGAAGALLPGIVAALAA